MPKNMPEQNQHQGQHPKRDAYKTNLQYYRSLCGLTQVELAEQAGVNLRTLQGYEQGRKNINNAGTATVSRLAEALGVGVPSLLEQEA